MRVVLLTRDDQWCRHAISLTNRLHPLVLQGEWGQPVPDVLGREGCDILISFLNPWVIPQRVLDCYKLAINFHPGDRNYPGIGCYNFALYEGAERYGAVAHHMAAAVDTGPIFMERAFKVGPDETIASLRERTLITMLAMLSETIDMLPDIPACDIQWSRRPFKRSELDALCEIDASMSGDEIGRRIRATSYPGKPGAKININGFTFVAH